MRRLPKGAYTSRFAPHASQRKVGASRPCIARVPHDKIVRSLPAEVECCRHICLSLVLSLFPIFAPEDTDRPRGACARLWKGELPGISDFARILLGFHPLPGDFASPRRPETLCQRPAELISARVIEKRCGASVACAAPPQQLRSREDWSCSRKCISYVSPGNLVTSGRRSETSRMSVTGCRPEIQGFVAMM